ncbi:isoamylase early set domain-containing protein [Vibrio vulnificus]|uniref:isoamylase early set domain-containing protein n=1 Tax=Vibrio vulnificus TaxID=672 RepID=UPI00307236EE
MLKKRFFKTKDEVEVTFEVQQENWESAHVVGEFNNWKPEPMTLVKKSGLFKFKTRLPREQKVEFRYLFNQNQWGNDPQADGYVANGFGSDNGFVSTSE